MNSQPSDKAQAGKFVGAVFGIAFLGIGLTVLGSLWLAPFGEFHSPPLVFRIFGSFIALVFVAVGGAVARASIMGKPGQLPTPEVSNVASVQPGQAAAKPVSYVCPKFNASLTKDAEVSPLGDVKCTFCGGWFNIHGKSA